MVTDMMDKILSKDVANHVTRDTPSYPPDYCFCVEDGPIAPMILICNRTTVIVFTTRTKYEIQMLMEQYGTTHGPVVAPQVDTPAPYEGPTPDPTPAPTRPCSLNATSANYCCAIANEKRNEAIANFSTLYIDHISSKRGTMEIASWKAAETSIILAFEYACPPNGMNVENTTLYNVPEDVSTQECPDWDCSSRAGSDLYSHPERPDKQCGDGLPFYVCYLCEYNKGKGEALPEVCSGLIAL